MNIENLTALIIAVIGSGGISSAIATLLAARKHKVEIEQIKQQVENDKVDTKIKIDEHVQKQMMDLNNSYKEEFEKRRKEIEELHEINSKLKQQVEALSLQIDQLMSWVVYDSTRYQEWLENELLNRDPDIKFPNFRKPPKFLNDFIASTSSSSEETNNNEQTVHFTLESDDDNDDDNDFVDNL